MNNINESRMTRCDNNNDVDKNGMHWPGDVTNARPSGRSCSNRGTRRTIS